MRKSTFKKDKDDKKARKEDELDTIDENDSKDEKKAKVKRKLGRFFTSRVRICFNESFGSFIFLFYFDIPQP